MYTKTIDYNGSAIVIDIDLATGTVSGDPTLESFLRPENTNTVTVTIDGGTPEEIADIPDSQLLVRLAQLQTDAQAFIDGVANAQLVAALLTAGYELT